MALGVIPFYSGNGITNNYSVERLITEYLPYTCFKDNVGSYLEHLKVQKISFPKIKSIYNLIQFTNIARSSLSIDLFHSIADNLQNIPELDVNINMEENPEAKGTEKNMPVIWYDDKGTEFWFIYQLSFGYKFYKCDYSAKTYRIYTVFLGSEVSEDTANILHPKLNPIIYENKHNPKYISLASWEFTTSKTKQELTFKLLGDSNKDEDLRNDFRSLKLVRLRNNHHLYGSFCSCLEYKNDCWQLKSGFKNEYPGTDYFYYPSLYSVSKDGIQVQKVRETDSGYELIENEYYFVDNSWIDDIDTMRLTDSVGVILLTDENGRKKKYLALDCYCLYFPIKEDDTVDFDILEDE